MNDKLPATSSCCSSPQDVRDIVRDEYGRIATAAGAPGCGCCASPGAAEDIARRVGYSPDDLRGLPEGANMGLSCGNPAALAGLSCGEVVLDLGCGGGFDVFLAGPRVGPTGRVIGVDMTPQMISKARRGIDQYRARTGLDNVEFRLGEIEHLPVADASIDVVISNCVINLSPDKPAVWREIARVLRPGGRVAISDIALLRPLPQTVRKMAEALVGCVAGAILIEEYRSIVEAAGFTDISLEPRRGYMDALASAGSELYLHIAEALPAGSTPGDFVTSIDIKARKPAAGVCCCKA